MDYTVIYRIADPNATILMKVEAENEAEAQDKADNAFQLEHSTDMWKDWCVDNVVEGHDGVMAQVGEKLNYGHGFNETNSIAIVWSIDDVRYQLKDTFNVPMDSLTDEECMQVLRIVERKHDANEGTSYYCIEYYIEHLFGDKIFKLQKEQEVDEDDQAIYQNELNEELRKESL